MPLCDACRDLDWLYGRAVVSDVCRRRPRQRNRRRNHDTPAGNSRIPSRSLGFALRPDGYEGATLRWVFGMVRRVLGARTPLSSFVASSVTPRAYATKQSYNSSQSGDRYSADLHFGSHTPLGPAGTIPSGDRAPGIFPMPPPYDWEVGHGPASTRRAHRWRRHRAVDILVNLVVCASNYLVLGRPRVAPPRYRKPQPPDTDVRRAVVHGLRADCSLMIRPPFFFGGRGRAKLQAVAELSAQIFNAEINDVVRPPPHLVSSPFKASRARFLNTPEDDLKNHCFDPTHWLPMLEAACYQEPRLLETDESRAAKCPLPVSRFSAPREEAIAFAKQLDRAGRLFLATPEEAPKEDRMNVLAVYKSEDIDRTVWDRRRRNFREVHLSGAAADLPTGYDLTDVELPGEDYKAYLFLDDVSDMYPCFVSSTDRAKTNCLAIELTPTECFGMKALKRFPPGLAPPRLIPCCGSLVMGDVNAVDIATGAHLEVLRQAEALPEVSRVRHGCPTPRGPGLHALVIDDHVGIAVGRNVSAPAYKSMYDCFERGSVACAKAGIPHHPGKKVRGETDGLALGGELVQGRTLGTERIRRSMLSVLSLSVARHGKATGMLMRKLLASWTYCMLYRRPTMCLLGSCFKDLPPIKDDNIVYNLPVGSRDDLVLSACFAPLMFSHLGATHSDSLICTDASDTHIAATAAPSTTNLSQELWRVRERRGWSAHLVGKATEYVLACGSEREVAEIGEELLGAWADLSRGGRAVPDPPRQLVERFDFLELCCGRSSPLIKACTNVGLRCGPKLDLLLHEAWDIRTGRLIEWVVFLVYNRRVLWFHCGAPCTTFSIARCPKLRSKLCPLGFDPSEDKTQLGNLLLFRTLAVLFAIFLAGNRAGYTRFSVGSHEHPQSAFSWFLPQVKTLFDHEECGSVLISMCQFKAIYRKNTRLGYVFADRLQVFEGRVCPGGECAKNHVRLEGSLTTKASCYPDALCEEWAEQIVLTKTCTPDPLDEYSPEGNHRAGALEDLAFNEILLSADWATIMREACGDRKGRRIHINIKEIRGCLRTVRRRALLCYHQRQVYGLDSQVAIGALAKGRSPSYAINNELRSGLPDTLALRHYGGYKFAPTRHNPADHPTRDTVIPMQKPCPGFVRDCCRGVYSDWDAWAALPRQTRSTSTWARFFIRLLRPSALVSWEECVPEV